ncbi:Ada metal-binding domain-containing protein [Ideonella margarita]|uniref:DNA-3-methyladenine glycosylase II n=1 Tax=Ideonella margarita TaxID=2984191 RepID=A0ABU9C888_9BURK
MSTPDTPLQSDAAYRALSTRDARFDGRFFVGVTSTGIYCRPVCRVRVPRAENCRFFPHAAAAEQGGFRPCLRCRPELAPGLSLTDTSRTLARTAASMIERAVADGLPVSLADLAGRLGVTDRHLRRIFAAEFDVSPIDWLTTHRLLLAKQLLTDTRLPVTQVALASGFGSLRRFNDAFASHYRLAPGALRKAGEPRNAKTAPVTAHDAGDVTLTLPWRAPYDVAAMRQFLANRPLPGVEAHAEGVWRRTLRVPHLQTHLTGWISLTLDETRGAARVGVSASLAPALGAVRRRVRHLLDVDTDTTSIDAALQNLPGGMRPGLRVPGCMDGFETTVRIILGQQVTVAAACTLAGRLVRRFGEPVSTPHEGLTHLFPTAQALAEADPAHIGELGIVRTRVGALQALARAVSEGVLHLDRSEPMEQTLQNLQSLPGIGPWTCELVAMRVLGWPDAFPASDIGVINALGGLKPAASVPMAEAWRPWRSYAVLQLWQQLPVAAPKPPSATAPARTAALTSLHLDTPPQANT